MSIVVVAVMNTFELSMVESKAFTIIKKITLKNRMKDNAAQIISKFSKMYLNVKHNRPVDVGDIYGLNNTMGDFKNDLRKYKSQKDEDKNEELLREFDRIKGTNKEILMFLSVMAKMIQTKSNSLGAAMMSKDDKRLASLLVELQDKREEIKMLKSQELKNIQTVRLRSLTLREKSNWLNWPGKGVMMMSKNSTPEIYWRKAGNTTSQEARSPI